MRTIARFAARALAHGAAAAVFACAGIAEAAVLERAEQTPQGELATCGAGQRLQLTLGLPAGYPELPAGDRPIGRRGFEQVCVSTATGSPYQLLSWLENDHLQVVVLPELAVAVLARESPLTFPQDYLVLDSSPFSLLALDQRTLGLAQQGTTIHGKASFEKLFALALGSGKPPTILLPHHLSAAVDHLLSQAVTAADARGLSGKQRDLFFTRLTQGIAFRQLLPPGASANADFAYVPVAASGPDDPWVAHDRDVLVIHRHVVSSYPQLQRTIAAVQKDAAAAATQGRLEWLGEPGKEKGVLAAFYADNYKLHQYGSISRRYFRFTIPELWAFLEGDVAAARIEDPLQGGLALVLTGGGVKAAYQTRLVEELYRSKRLRNATVMPAAQPEAAAEGPDGAEPQPAADPSARAQEVNYVIGTSGGALLGIFVSALDDEVLANLSRAGNAALTSVLWGEEGARIRSRQIFPLQDMLRYGSILVCFVLILLVATFTRRAFHKRYPDLKKALPAHATNPHPHRAWHESPFWIALLVFAPAFIVSVADDRGLEHMPAISGMLYLAMALIALDSDQRLIPTAQPFRWRKVRLSLWTAVLLVAGLLAVFGSLQFDWVREGGIPGCDDWAPGVVLCSAGFVLLALALHSFFRHQKAFLETQQPAPHLRALALVLGIVVVSHLVLIAGIGLGKAAILEMSGSFWRWLLGSTLVLSIAAIAMGMWARTPGVARFPGMNATVAFLFSEHPSRAWFLGHRRLVRFVLLATAAFLWWNVIAAPALYGNCNAREYFEDTYESFAAKAGRDVEKQPLPLSVPFVVTATSLEKSQERYFMFPRAGAAQNDGIQSDVWFKLVSDPRWLVVRDFQNEDLRSVAFASGSPFPVFASHGVRIQSLQIDERFIDGGFAHNRPLDAARALGAHKALVLNSSPLPIREPAGECRIVRLRLSELACNLPRLVPYLWERSQTEDDLSSMSMLVASIYPTAAEGDWPALTDFRGEVVDRLVRAADEDVSRRVGVIESWGAPKFSPARLTTINMGSVERMLQQKR